MKTSDYEYKYEAGKGYYAEGYYRKAAEAFGQVLAALKGTQYGDECLFLLGMSNYRMGDFEAATQYFKKYYQSLNELNGLHSYGLLVSLSINEKNIRRYA